MDTRILLDQICEIVKEAGELIRGCSSVGERKAKEGAANFVTKYAASSLVDISWLSVKPNGIYSHYPLLKFKP